MTGRHPKTKPEQKPNSDLDGGWIFKGGGGNQTDREGGVDPNCVRRTSK